ncbi:MAG TPA: hypothetical protein VGI39_19915, partial [Polyangiaceae bacterium]
MKIRLAHVALLTAGAGAAACESLSSPGASQASPEKAGRAVALLAEVPADVMCVQVDVAGARQVTDRFDVTPGETATLSLTGLPLGTDLFTGYAYPTACAAVASPVEATWISAPTSATLAAQMVASISLSLVPNGQASVGIGFVPDDGGAGDADGSAPGDGGVDGSEDTDDAAPPATPTGLSLAAVTATVLAGSGTAGFADGTGTAAMFAQPYGVAVDGTGNVYVTDQLTVRVRKVTPAGVVTTLAGSGGTGGSDGTGGAASFTRPSGLGVDAAGNLYLGDVGNQNIRKVTPGGVVTTLAGPNSQLNWGSAGFLDGTGANARFFYPYGVATDSAGNVLVADYANNRIRRVTPAGVVTTLAGSGATAEADGTGAGASFNNPFGITVDAAGTVYVADI